MLYKTPKGVVIIVAVIMIEAKVKAMASPSFRKDSVGSDILFACFIAYDAPK